MSKLSKQRAKEERTSPRANGRTSTVHFTQAVWPQMSRVGKELQVRTRPKAVLCLRSVRIEGAPYGTGA